MLTSIILDVQSNNTSLLQIKISSYVFTNKHYQHGALRTSYNVNKGLNTPHYLIETPANRYRTFEKCIRKTETQVLTGCETPCSERDAPAFSLLDGIIERAARITTLTFTDLINPKEGAAFRWRRSRALRRTQDWQKIRIGG